MKITGIIAEFNPFHNGHEYILSQARQKTGCDLVVVAMSGDFVQRGAPAILDRAVRTKAALLGGADLVIQLPVIASTASAADFALGGVAALAACGVDTLVFGCEQEDFSIFPALADFLSQEPEDYRKLLSNYLKEGCSYPLARARALADFFPEQEDLPELLSAPNNILALEYLRAIKRLGLSMQVCPIRRVAVGHHSREGIGEFASATAIRKQLLERVQSVGPARGAAAYSCSLGAGPVRGAAAYSCPSMPGERFVPDYAAQLLSTYLSRHLPLCEDDFSAALRYRLVQMKYAVQSGWDLSGNVPAFLDGSSDLYDRICNHLDEFTTLSGFCSLLHTKDCTLSRLKRLMFHILLNITEEQMALFRKAPCNYLRVLGFRKSTPAITTIKQNAEAQGIPVILSVADGKRELSGMKDAATSAYRNTEEKMSSAAPESAAESKLLFDPSLADPLFTQDLLAREFYIHTLTQKELRHGNTDCELLLNDYRQPLIII